MLQARAALDGKITSVDTIPETLNRRENRISVPGQWWCAVGVALQVSGAVSD